MPTIKKRSKTRSQQPEEEFRSIAHTVAEFVSRRKKMVFAAGGAALAALVIFGAFSLMRSASEKRAAMLLPAAFEYLSPMGGAQPDYQKAFEKYKEIAKQHTGTMSASIAQYYAGNCLANLGQYEEALKEYRAFVDNYSGEKFLLGLVYQRMAYAYVNLGKQDEALKAFGRSEEVSGAGLATVELARLYESSGKIEEAQKKYKEITDKLPSTMWAMEARTKLPAPNLSAVPGPGTAQGNAPKGTAAK